MRVVDLFRVGPKTILSVRLEGRPEPMYEMDCDLEVDGVAVSAIRIRGAVAVALRDAMATTRGDLDVWTTSSVETVAAISSGTMSG